MDVAAGLRRVKGLGLALAEAQNLKASFMGLAPGPVCVLVGAAAPDARSLEVHVRAADAALAAALQDEISQVLARDAE